MAAKIPNASVEVIGSDGQSALRAALIAALTYEPETGVFRYRSPRRGVRAGEVAGALHDSGYQRIGLNGKDYYAHNLAWLYIYGEWCPGRVDHINRDRGDNRIANLRKATFSQNSSNKPVRNRRYPYPGIARSAKTAPGHFWSRITVKGKRIHLGTFPSAEEAYEAYQVAARRYFGEFSPV